MRSLTYQSLQDFSGLPAVRDAIAHHEPGFLLDDLPALRSEAKVEELGFVKLHKNDIQGSSSPSSDAAVAVMQTLHGYSHAVLKNLSHALELPWEKYLGEMHEFSAPGRDELQTLPLGEPLPNEWSTLTLVMNSLCSQKALVVFGAALSVFSENMTPEPSDSVISIEAWPKFFHQAQGNWIVYYLRPNDGVFYTRTAGALMTPLSTGEYDVRKRVEDIDTA